MIGVSFREISPKIRKQIRKLIQILFKITNQILEQYKEISSHTMAHCRFNTVLDHEEKKKKSQKH